MFPYFLYHIWLIRECVSNENQWFNSQSVNCFIELGMQHICEFFKIRILFVENKKKYVQCNIAIFLQIMSSETLFLIALKTSIKHQLKNIASKIKI